MLRHALWIVLVAMLAGLAASARAEDIGALHCSDSTGVPLRNGQAVTVSGVVTGQFSTARNVRLFLQDGTGGIDVFGAPKDCAPAGDSIRVSGVVGVYSGLTEIVGGPSAPLKIEVLAHGRAVPAPLPLTLAAVNATDQGGCEPNESRLIVVANVFVRTASGAMPEKGATFGDDRNYRLISAGPDSAASSITMRVQEAEGCDTTRSLEPVAIPVDTPVTVVGILSQFTGRASRTGGYQLLPRSRDDLQPTIGPARRR